MINESRLLQNLKRKKRNCLEEIIKMYTPYVNVVVYNIIGSIASAEDIEEVISDTFVSLWRHADSVSDNKGGIRAYLGAIARNTAKNKLRKCKVYDNLDENTESRLAGPQDTILKKERTKFLTDMISALGEPDSEIFFRYYYYEEKINKIASVMNIPSSTIKTKLSRGKIKLKQAINQKEDLL